MVFAFLIFCAISFKESPVLLDQIECDQHGFSCNTIDGVPGPKTDRARLFAAKARAGKLNHPFRVVTVTQADLDALVQIPTDPADKAKLPRMGYETIKEMFAERGHMSQRGLERLNPGVDWNNVRPGLELVIPDFPTSIESYLRPEVFNEGLIATLVRISLSKFEIAAYVNDSCVALFPCSIARDKSKLPPEGELKIVTCIPNPNYTYSPDHVPAGKKASKYVFPEGPNCPVGVAWMGLNLPGYGIHGTPRPESIGNAESHGCFRLANWNAARLFYLVRPGTRVIIEQ